MFKERDFGLFLICKIIQNCLKMDLKDSWNMLFSIAILLSRFSIIPGMGMGGKALGPLPHASRLNLKEVSACAV